jgi:hypothetical protein
LGDAVSRHLGSVHSIESLRRLSGGASRETWSFEAVALDGTRVALILRRDPLPEAVMAAPIDEYALIEAAGAAGVPVAPLRFRLAEEDGLGLRDHSWGPRHWQSPWWYRWLTANLGPDFGFVVSVVASKDGKRHIGGAVLRNGAYELINEATIQTDWTGADRYHQKIRATATTSEGTYDIEGTVKNLVPLRNRRTGPDGEELLTRISEGLTEWRCEGRVGHGLSEYLDQIVDGRPVGFDG